MSYRRVLHRVESVSLDGATRYRDGHLALSRARGQELVRSPALAAVRLSWLSPGDPVRIINVLDAIEPRAKGPGGGGVFPGLLAPVSPSRSHEIHVARGALVVPAGHLPRAQAAVADMFGPHGEHTPLGSHHVLALEFEPAPGADWKEVAAAVRLGALRLAVHLAEATLEAEPDEVEELAPVEPATTPNQGGLPRVGVITNLQGQGAFKDVLLYGRTVAGLLPTLLEPIELEDGAIVSAQYGHPALRNPTCMHQNHPVVAALRERHEVDLVFAGLILAPEPEEAGAKELVSAHAAWLARACGFDAAIVTKEGGGNADADLVLKMDELERLGITAVGIAPECAGRYGIAPPLIAFPQVAEAFVSVGNYEERVCLPAVERVLGGDRLGFVDGEPIEKLDVPMAALYAALNPLGWGRLTCREVV